MHALAAMARMFGAISGSPLSDLSSRGVHGKYGIGGSLNLRKISYSFFLFHSVFSEFSVVNLKEGANTHICIGLLWAAGIACLVGGFCEFVGKWKKGIPIVSGVGLVIFAIVTILVSVGCFQWSS